MPQVRQGGAPGFRCEELHSSATLCLALPQAVPGVTQTPWECCLGLLVKDVHLVLVQAFGTAKLQSSLTSTKVQVFLSVADVLAPVTDLEHKTHTTKHIS